uniref:Uncharacterized protein n=1 Tax=Globisporangium ultimum (strain ATCC 200006 / CBS 805.95 / DAOM BR144) TaxID=431595 RepID=K3X6L2_GLOUD
MDRIVNQLQRVYEVWTASQVDLGGRYSLSRLHDFNAYSKHASMLRVAAMCLLTPLPCLVLMTLMDCIPLAPPDAGTDANYIYWFRNSLVTLLISYTALEQFRTTVLGLPIRFSHVHTIAFVSSLGAIAFEYMLSRVIGFPLPFTLAEGVFVWGAIIVAMFLCFFGRTIRANEQVKNDLGNSVGVLYGQISMSVAYPAFIYGFNSIDPAAQKYYVVLLPILKLLFKDWISRFMGEYDDKKPENIIINVEFFNAFYVACCMQRTSSISTTLVLLLIDWTQMMSSLVELNAINVQSKRLMCAIPVGHKWYGKTSIEVALCIIEEDERIRTHPSLRESCLHSGQAAFRRRSLRSQEPKIPNSQRNTVRIVPVVSALPPHGQGTGTAVNAPTCADVTVEQDRQLTELAQACVGEQHDALKQCSKPTLDLLTDENERLKFVQRVTELLFTIEFVVLIEYVEVIVPIIYSTYIVGVYHLKNRAYYAHIATLDGDELKRTISNVMVYAGLEFMSFTAVTIMIYRRMGVATLKQLSFVLERQWTVVHTKLLTWV